MARTVIFDAVHTILRPMPDVRSAYWMVGKKHGSRLTRDQVGDRFPIARRSRFGTDVSAAQTEPGSLRSSDEIERQLWRGLVSDVFLEVQRVDALFEELWNHFASAANWQLYDDVEQCWTQLRAQGDQIVIASNFDSRLHDIVSNQKTLRLADAVFCSAEVGYRKPDPKFYKSISDSLGLDDASEVLMIGDDYENDFAAPELFGWDALHLDRRASARSVGVISDLTQIFE